jgi:hypothetical protein
MTRQLLLLFAATLAPTTALVAQNEPMRVMRAALGFVHDSLPPGALAFNAAAPLILRATDAELARELGGPRMQARDFVQCNVVGTPQRRVCNTLPRTTLVTFDDALIRGDSATLNVSWRYQAAPGRVASRSLALQLVRTSSSVWRVTRVIGRGMS